MKISSRELVLLGLLGVLVFVPSLQYERWGIDYLYNHKRLFQIGSLLLAGTILITIKTNREIAAQFIQLYSLKVKLAFAVIILLGGLSAFYAELTDWAFLDYSHYLLILVITFFIGVITYRDSDKSQLYLQAAVIGFVCFYLARVAVFYLLYHFGEVPLWPGDLNDKALFSFSNIRFFNQTQTWTIPILASLGWFYWRYTKNNLYRWGLVVLIAGWGTLVFASGARGTILGVVIGILFIWFFLVQEKWKFFLYHASLAGISIISYNLLFSYGEEGKETVLRTNNLRSYWPDVIDKIFQEPILGYGPMHYASVLLGQHNGHPHNWFLQFSYEWGLIVAILFLMLALLGLYNCGIYLNGIFDKEGLPKKKYWVQFGIYWSLIAAFIHGLFSGLAVMPLSQTWFVLICGMAMGLYFNEKKKRQIQDNYVKGTKIFLVFLVLISFVGYVNWAINNPIDRNEVDARFYQESTSSRSYPRFWQQGRIGIDQISGIEEN